MWLPRIRLLDGDGRREKEWRSQTIQAYKRLTKRAEAIIANTYLAGTNTRRVRRALAGLFGGKVGKDAVSRAWRKVKTDWESWQVRDLSGEDIVRLILDGTGVKARLDRRATSIPLLVAVGVPGQVVAQMPRRGGQPGRGGGSAVRLPALSAAAMEVHADHQRHRTPARGVQAPGEDPMRAAQRGNGGHAVLGLDGLGADRHAPRRWLANAGPSAGQAAD